MRTADEYNKCPNVAVLLCSGRYGMHLQAEACVSDCSSAVEVDPGRVKAYFRRALAREQLGEDGDALRDAKRVLEVLKRCCGTLCCNCAY